MASLSFSARQVILAFRGRGSRKYRERWVSLFPSCCLYTKSGFRAAFSSRDIDIGPSRSC